MGFCFFAHFRAPPAGAPEIGDDELSTVSAVIASVKGLARALLHYPAPGGTAHAFAKDEAPPPLVLQLYADRIEVLEDALRTNGSLQPLCDPQSGAGLHAFKLQQQIMLLRHLAIGPLESASPQAIAPCSYLVHYPGQAADLSAWHRHYIDFHPPIMRRFPRVREIEICTRLDWIGGLPGMRVDFMQRNKLMFDSASDLSAALASPVIGEMRADFHTFPDFAGGNVHYPMLTRTLAVAGAA